MKKKIFRIKNARAIVENLDLQAVVVIAVERDGTIRTITYGENKKKCKAIGNWAKNTVEHNLSIFPFKSIFGWGNKGNPVTSSEDFEKLTDYQKEKIIELGFV